MESVWPALLLSLKVAGLATAIDLVLGVAVGWLLARRRFPGREFLDTVLTLPMVLPPTVLGYYLLVLIGRRGWLGGWLHDTFGINLIFTWQGAVIAASVVAFPLVFKPARAAFMDLINPFYITLEGLEKIKKKTGKVVGIMHSLPRNDVEFDYAIDDSEFQLYFRQIGFSIPIRMALIAGMVGVD